MNERAHGSDLVYQAVVQRRAQYDVLLWQVPVLSLTAQAFLFSIALSADASQVARLIASLLAAGAAALSMQLMAKHRHHESLDSRWLQSYEESCGWPAMHARGPERPRSFPHAASAGDEQMAWWLRLRSYRLWMGGLAAFGLAGIVIVLMTLVSPDLLR